MGAPSFPASALTHPHMFVAIGPEVSNATTRTATSLRNQTERHVYCEMNKETSKLSQLHTTNFARICIDVHVQGLRDRVVAKLALAKLLSRWRTPVIQDGAEFCIRFIALKTSNVNDVDLLPVFCQGCLCLVVVVKATQTRKSAATHGCLEETQTMSRVLARTSIVSEKCLCLIDRRGRRPEIDKTTP